MLNAKMHLIMTQWPEKSCFCFYYPSLGYVLSKVAGLENADFVLFVLCVFLSNGFRLDGI